MRLPITPRGHVLIVTGIEPVSRLDHDISIAAALAVILDGPCLGERPDTIRLRLPFRHTIKNSNGESRTHSISGFKPEWSAFAYIATEN